MSLLLTVFKYISNFFLIVDFEQANVCSVHIEKANIFEDNIGHSCVIYYFKCEQNLLRNNI